MHSHRLTVTVLTVGPSPAHLAAETSTVGERRESERTHRDRAAGTIPHTRTYDIAVQK